MKILLIDNYDSFSYNLVHYLESANAEVVVYKNDQIPLFELAQFDAFVISPGPGLPNESGQLMLFLEKVLKLQKPILGICLGFQALVELHGGQLYNQEKVKHGVSETCVIEFEGILLKNLPDHFEVGLYHSWAANQIGFPENLKITSKTEQGIIMSFENSELKIFGAQFHPESILTPQGKTIIQNFLNSIDSSVYNQ